MSPGATGWEPAQMCLRPWLRGPPFELRDGKRGLRSSGGRFEPRAPGFRSRDRGTGGGGPAAHVGAAARPQRQCHRTVPTLAGHGSPAAAFVLHEQSWSLGEKVCRPRLDPRAPSEQGRRGAPRAQREPKEQAPGSLPPDLPPAQRSERAMNTTHAVAFGVAPAQFAPRETPLRQRPLPALDGRRAPAREGICLPQDTARKCRRWDLTPRPGQHTPVLAAGGPAVVPESLGEGPRQVRLRASWGDEWPRAPRSPREKTGLSVQHEPPLLQPSQRGVRHSEDPGKDRRRDSASKPGLRPQLARRLKEPRDGAPCGNARRAKARGKNHRRCGVKGARKVTGGEGTRNTPRLPI